MLTTQRKRTFLLPLAALALLLASLAGFFGMTRPAKAATSVTGLHVSGNQILNANNQVVRLVGVDRSGTEYECNSGGNTNIFDGPTDASGIAAMLSWDINVVRIPLNEDCWLGINGEPSAAYTSAQYQQAIISFVNALTADNLIVILDLHWNAPGTQQANSQQPMPDLDHAPAFWTSIASTFKSNSSVIFDLYNEPYPTSWACWLNGSTAANTSPCIGLGFPSVGMQALVNTVRATGATNPIMLGGLAYSNDLSQWLQFEPTDPDKNLIASVHIYNFNACATTSCWASTVAPVAAQVPVIAGEIGENDCASTFINTLMGWLDQAGISYLAWSWNADNCASGPSLISDYTGTPTAYGAGYKAHLLALNLGSAPGGTPTPSPTGTPASGVTPTPGITPTPTSTSGVTPTPGITPTPTNTPVAGSGITVSYQLSSQWPGGLSVNIAITNNGAATVNGWTLQFTFPGDQKITQLWGGSYTQSGAQVTITNLSYNGTIAPGQTISFGFNGSWTSNNTSPTTFTFNGTSVS